MNLSESVKFVLKNKTQNIFQLMVKEDLKKSIKEIPANVVAFTKYSNRAIRRFSVKESLSEVKSSVYGTALLIKVIPQRTNEGMKIFFQDFIRELDQLSDPKERTVFCMKVLAGLSKFALSAAYDVGLGDIKLLGFGRSKVTYSRAIVAKLIFKTLQSFIVRFIDEVEKEIEGQDDLNQLETLKKIVLDDSGNAIDKFFEGITDPDDRAFKLVDNLRSYIVTGE
jgi:hypothetical protein